MKRCKAGEILQIAVGAELNEFSGKVVVLQRSGTVQQCEATAVLFIDHCFYIYIRIHDATQQPVTSCQ
jgi:hypothetical protein